jgi:multidrug efflux pump
VQLSQAIVYGLGFATVLTLVLTPCALMLRENVGVWWARRRGPTREDQHAQRSESLPKAAE